VCTGAGLPYPIPARLAPRALPAECANVVDRCQSHKEVGLHVKSSTSDSVWQSKRFLLLPSPRGDPVAVEAPTAATNLSRFLMSHLARAALATLYIAVVIAGLARLFFSL